MRLGEVLPLEWDRVNRGEWVFRVEETKTGVPLELRRLSCRSRGSLRRS